MLEREGVLNAPGAVRSARSPRPLSRKTKPPLTASTRKAVADLVVRVQDGVRYGMRRPKEFNTAAVCSYRISFDVINESGRILSIRRPRAFLDDNKRPLVLGGGANTADLQPRGGRESYNLETALVEDSGELPSLVSLEFEVIQEDKPRLYLPSPDGRGMVLSEAARGAGLKRMAKHVPDSGKLLSKVIMLRGAPGNSDAWLVLDESGATQTVPCSMLLGSANEPLETT